MAGAAAGIRLEAQVFDLEAKAQISCQRVVRVFVRAIGLTHLGRVGSLVFSASVEMKETEPPLKDVLCARDPARRQLRRHHPRLDGQAGVKPFGVSAVDHRLQRARRLAQDDSQSVSHALRIKLQQFCRCSRRPESAANPRQMPSGVALHRKAEPTRQIHAQDERGEKIRAAHVFRLRKRQRRRNHARARMHPRHVVRVVKIPRMGHRAIRQGRERGGRASPEGGDGRLRRPSPFFDLRHYLPHTRGGGAGQDAAESIDEGALGGGLHMSGDIFRPDICDEF